MNRRSFINWVGVGAIANSWPLAIAACVSAKENDFIVVGTVSQLNRDGKIFRDKSAIGPVLVIKTSNNNSDNNLVAVNPTCPHKGCTVEWEAEEKQFDCPCHDSDFGIDGSVIEGPAKKPLKVYAAKIVGEQVLVKA